MDLFIVGVIVLAASGYMVLRMVRSAKSKSCGGCSCGCGTGGRPIESSHACSHCAPQGGGNKHD